MLYNAIQSRVNRILLVPAKNKKPVVKKLRRAARTGYRLKKAKIMTPLRYCVAAKDPRSNKRPFQQPPRSPRKRWSPSLHLLGQSKDRGCRSQLGQDLLESTRLTNLARQLLHEGHCRIDMGPRDLGTKPNGHREGSNDECGIACESNRGQEKGCTHKLRGNRCVHLCLSLENLLDELLRQRKDHDEDNRVNRRLRGLIRTRGDADENTRNEGIEKNRNLSELEDRHRDILVSKKIESQRTKLDTSWSSLSMDTDFLKRIPMFPSSARLSPSSPTCRLSSCRPTESPSIPSSWNPRTSSMYPNPTGFKSRVLPRQPHEMCPRLPPNSGSSREVFGHSNRMLSMPTSNRCPKTAFCLLRREVGKPCADCTSPHSFGFRLLSSFTTRSFGINGKIGFAASCLGLGLVAFKGMSLKSKAAMW